jgi:hypothetical protein
MWQEIAAERQRQDAIRLARGAARGTGDPLSVAFSSRHQDAVDRAWKRKWRRKMAAARHLPIRRALQATLRKLGFQLEHSGGGSNYYTKWVEGNDFTKAGWRTIRLSNHAVPETDERDYNRENGKRDWSHVWYADVMAYDTPAEAVADLLEHLDEQEKVNLDRREWSRRIGS